MLVCLRDRKGASMLEFSEPWREFRRQSWRARQYPGGDVRGRGGVLLKGDGNPQENKVGG